MAKAKAKSKEKSRRPSGRASWTKAELDALRKMAPTRPVGIIAYELGRTATAVRGKAAREGISFASPERSPYGKPISRKSKAASKK